MPRNQEASARVGLLQRRDVELLHGQHGAHGPLGLHRVGFPPPDAKIRGLFISPKLLSFQIWLLKRRGYRFMTLRDAMVSNGTKRAVLTFDDGYTDNLTAALPVLKKHNIPATLFIITGDVGRSDVVWEEAGEKRGMSGEREIPRRMTALPARRRQTPSQVGRLSLAPRILSHVVAQRVKGYQQQIVSADNFVHVHDAAASSKVDSRRRCQALRVAV